MNSNDLWKYSQNLVIKDMVKICRPEKYFYLLEAVENVKKQDFEKTLIKDWQKQSLLWIKAVYISRAKAFIENNFKKSIDLLS